MDMSKYAGSAFLSLDDLQAGPIRGEIAAVEIGNYDKPVVTFTNGLKFSLNATNTAALIKRQRQRHREEEAEAEGHANKQTQRSQRLPTLLKTKGAGRGPAPFISCGATQ
jgi:hypothetical protein